MSSTPSKRVNNERRQFLFNCDILLDADLSLPNDSGCVNAVFSKVYLDDIDHWAAEITQSLAAIKLPLGSLSSPIPSSEVTVEKVSTSEDTKSSEEDFIDAEEALRLAMGLPAVFGAPPKPKKKNQHVPPVPSMDFDKYWSAFGQLFVMGAQSLCDEGGAVGTFADNLACATDRGAQLLKEHRDVRYFVDLVSQWKENRANGRGDEEVEEQLNDTVKDTIRQDIMRYNVVQARNRAENFSRKIGKFSFVPGFPLRMTNAEGTGERPKTAEDILSPFVGVQYREHAPVFLGTQKRKNYSIANDGLDYDNPELIEPPEKMAAVDDDPKKFDFSYDPVRDSNLLARNAIKVYGFDKNLVKYWHQRYRLFTKLRTGDDILMDLEGWFSVTPEAIAAHIADRMVTHRRCVILDAFTGVGGNAIQFALRGAYVYAVDLDPVKIRCARQNAKVYGVEDRITFFCGNFYHIAKMFTQSRANGGSLAIDSVFLSPPWGGPDYVDQPEFHLHNCEPDGFDIFATALTISSNIAYFLPRNTSSKELTQISRDTPHKRVEIEHNVLNNKIKALTAYYGNLVKKC